MELREGSGEPAESIITTAKELDADTICVAGHSRSPAGNVLFGSVSQSVVLNTERSVLLCSESEGQSYRQPERAGLRSVNVPQSTLVRTNRTI